MSIENEQEQTFVSETFIYGSDDGIKAAVEKVKDSGEPYTNYLNPFDFHTTVEALRFFAMRYDGIFGDKTDLTANAKGMLEDVAKSVGIAWTHSTNTME